MKKIDKRQAGEKNKNKTLKNETALECPVEMSLELESSVQSDNNNPQHVSNSQQHASNSRQQNRENEVNADKKSFFSLLTKSNNGNNSNPNYRPDVDGLRAIAVWLVIGDHVGWKRVFPYGFLGVDVFFVISGYLITGLLYRDIVTKRSYTDVAANGTPRAVGTSQESEEPTGMPVVVGNEKPHGSDKAHGSDGPHHEPLSDGPLNGISTVLVIESTSPVIEKASEDEPASRQPVEKQVPGPKPETLKSILRAFYLRRVRRIAPALLTMIFVNCLFLMVFLLPHSILPSVLLPINATILCAANLYYDYFLLGDGYWGNNAAIEPFLHMWSLSLEEQFYFIWPWIMFGIDVVARKITPAIFQATPRRHHEDTIQKTQNPSCTNKNQDISCRNKTQDTLCINKNHRKISCVMLILSCFVIGIGSYVYTLLEGLRLVYFLLHARAFELLVGSILALLVAAREEFDISFARAVHWQVVVLRNFFGLLGLFFIMDASLSHDLLIRFAYNNDKGPYEDLEVGFNYETDVKLSKIVQAIFGAFMFIASGTPDRKRKVQKNSAESSGNSTTTEGKPTPAERPSTQQYSLPFHLMGHTFFVSNGLLSYSLYLWHFPIIVIMRYHNILNYYEDVEIVVGGFVIIFLTYVGAFCTYRFVECRLRFTKVSSFRDIYDCIVLRKEPSTLDKAREAIQQGSPSQGKSEVGPPTRNTAQAVRDRLHRIFFQGELRVSLFIYLLTPLAFFGGLTCILYAWRNGTLPERYHSLNRLPSTAYENRWGRNIFSARGLQDSARCCGTHIVSWSEWKLKTLDERKAFLVHNPVLPSHSLARQTKIDRKIVGTSTVLIGDSHLDLGYWDTILKDAGRKGLAIQTNIQDWHNQEGLLETVQEAIKSIQGTHIAILKDTTNLKPESLYETNPADFSIDFLAASGAWHRTDTNIEYRRRMEYDSARVGVRDIHDATHLASFEKDFDSLQILLENLNVVFKQNAKVANAKIYDVATSLFPTFLNGTFQQQESQNNSTQNNSNQKLIQLANTNPKFLVEYDNPELLGSAMPWCGLASISFVSDDVTSDSNVISNQCLVDLDASLLVFTKVTKMLQVVKAKTDAVILPSMYFPEMCAVTRPKMSSSQNSSGNGVNDIVKTNSRRERKCSTFIEVLITPTRRATHIFDYDDRFGPESGDTIRIPVFRGDKDHMTAASWEYMAYRLIEVYGNPLGNSVIKPTSDNKRGGIPQSIQTYNAEDMLVGAERDW